VAKSRNYTVHSLGQPSDFPLKRIVLFICLSACLIFESKDCVAMCQSVVMWTVCADIYQWPYELFYTASIRGDVKNIFGTCIYFSQHTFPIVLTS
jgi:hypothetical protein